jgi:hypothetical protein
LFSTTSAQCQVGEEFGLGPAAIQRLRRLEQAQGLVGAIEIGSGQDAPNGKPVEIVELFAPAPGRSVGLVA